MSYEPEDFWLHLNSDDILTIGGKEWIYRSMNWVGQLSVRDRRYNYETFSLADIGAIPELDKRKTIAREARDKLAAVRTPVPKDKWPSIKLGSELVLIERICNGPSDEPFLYGILHEHTSPEGTKYYTLDNNASTIAQLERLKKRLDPTGKWVAPELPSTGSGKLIHSTYVKSIYLLEGIEKDLDALPDLPDSTIPSTPTTPEASTPSTPTTPDTPELLAGLPSMTGFEQSTLGTGDCVWASPCHVLADRDLQLDETVYVWAVDPIDGRVLKTVSLTATEANKARVAWPAALVKAIQADDTLVEGSVLLQAGHLSNDAELTENTDAPTSQSFIGYNNVEKSQVDRLWAFDSHCKLLSNLPFKANQVCALTLADAEPPQGERVCIQVRHRTSQHLYESHFFQPQANSTGGSWSKQLCEFLNLHSAMLRVGKRQDDGISITPEEQGNQLWIPQLSDLSVQLESVNWLEHASFTVNADLALASEVKIAVHDDVTGAPLPGSPFTFRPSAATRAQNQWPSALASQLAGSPLAPYIKLEQASGSDTAPASTWRCLRAGVPLRIWMSEPLASPAWSSRSGEDIDDVLDACLGDESIQLLIESRDTRTGYLCFSSSITLSATESSTDQAAKRARLAETLNGHLKQKGAVWLGLSTDSNVAGTSQNIWEVREATALQLQTTLKKTIPTPIATDNQDTSPMSFHINEFLWKGPISTHNAKYGNIDKPYNTYNSHSNDSNNNKEPKDHISDIYYLYSELIQGQSKSYTFEPSKRLSIARKIAKDLTQINIHSNISIKEYQQTEEFITTEKYAISRIGELSPFSPLYIAQIADYLIPHKISIAEAFHTIASYFLNIIAWTDTLDDQFTPSEILAKIICDRKLTKQTLSNLATVRCNLATIDTLKSSREQLCIVLDAQTINRSFSLVSCSRNDDGFTLDLNAPFEPDEGLNSAGILIGVLSPSLLWRKIQNCKIIESENIEIPARDTLCVDLGNTNGSELFASSGALLHGVSPQTGLFHFHYPVATLSSLSGSTPAIPLALNYSPLRANESALGDGFAFSALSSYDNRKRRLVLSNGTVDELSIDDIKQLIKGEPIVRLGYTLKAAQGVTEELSAAGGKREVYHLTAFTVEYLNGNEEVLGLPQTHDNLESGGGYKDKRISLINKLIPLVDKILEELKTPSKDAPPVWNFLGFLFGGPLGATAASKIDDYEKTQSVHLYSVAAGLISNLWGAELLGKDREKLKQVIADRTKMNKLKTEAALELADIQRNALILVPLQLKADSRALQLDWEGVKGHVRLNSIKDGVNVLLEAKHPTEPVLEGNQQSVFTLWPETDERCCITLDIKDCLLRRLTRSSGSQTDQRLHFQYAATPTLDNVLCCVAEDDGSREVVAYDWDWDSESNPQTYTLPRVTLHTYVPGGQQPNTHHAWAWEREVIGKGKGKGKKQITAATRYAHAPVGSDLKQVPFTRWEWSYIDDETVKPDPQPNQKPDEEPEDNKKVMQLARQIEEVPGEQRRITAYGYSTDMTLPKPLRRPRQTAQHITVEDLRVAATAEDPQP